VDPLLFPFQRCKQRALSAHYGAAKRASKASVVAHYGAAKLERTLN
jgi:hypothetical protein